jgi:flagellar hook-basal body complex protein FliE
MLRAGLILVILLGLGALGITQFQVAPKIAGLESDLAAAESARSQAESAQRSAESAQREAEEAAETLRGELTEAKDSLKNAGLALAQQRARGDELDAQLNEATDALTEARRELQTWKGLGVTKEYVVTMKQQLQDANDQIAAIEAEKDVLTRQLDQTKYELSRFVGPSQKVIMRDGMEGAVLSVDPDWGFVIINVGEEDGALENGELLVSREGKLVGKVQISSVEKDRSIANVLPGWLQADIQVGDVVLY